MPASPTLLLFPTELERQRFRDQGGIEPGYALRATSGFGPVAAAAHTAQLVSMLKPRRVLLLGIAGTYDVERFPIGSALAFTRVAIDGVGAGEGASFQGPPALGFPQWPGSPGTTPEPVDDMLPLAALLGTAPALLLTTCAASDSAAHAADRRARFPEAVAEDMEGFAVALAAALQRVPCAIVRGISNEVGDRDAGRWRIPAALAEARRIGLQFLSSRDWDA